MTLSSNSARNDHTITAVVAVYAYSFKVFDEGDLEVILRDADTDAETTLTLTTHYTVSGVRSATGGNVTLLAAAGVSTGDHLTIRRKVALTQETDIRNQGRYAPELHENQFDKLVMIDQQQQDEIERSMRLPETVDPDDVSVELPPPIANRALLWNNTATALETRAIDSSADVALPGDGRSTETLTEYLGNNADFNVRDYGADPDGTNADNTTAINLAITKAALVGGGVVRIPPGISYNQVDIETDATVELVDDSKAAQRRTGLARPFIPGVGISEVIAHRAGNHAPENTLAAFGYSARWAHSAEFDIDLSSDDTPTPVVIHDLTLDRTTDGTGPVNEATITELRALDAGSWWDARFTGAMIPTLREVLAFCAPRFRRVYAEIKREISEAHVKIIVDAIIDAGLEDRCVIPSFWISNFPHVRKYSKAIVLGYECKDLPQWNTALPLAEADGNAMLIPDCQILLDDPDKVEDATARGIDIAVWTVETSDVVLQLIDIGVTKYITSSLIDPAVSL